MTADGEGPHWVRDLRFARAFVELGGALPDVRTSPDEPTPGAGEQVTEDDHRSWDRLAVLCVELLDVDAAAVFLLDGGPELRLVAHTDDTHVERDEAVRPARPAPVSGRRRPGAQPARVRSLISSTAVSARHPGWHPAPGEQTRFHRRALALHQQGSILGTLDLLRRGRGPLPPEDIALGQALADVAAATALYRRSLRRSEAANQQLQAALDRRIVIEQAKGIVSHSHGITLDAAFELMRGYARHRNVVLRDVARRVVVDGGAFIVDDARSPEVGVRERR